MIGHKLVRLDMPVQVVENATSNTCLGSWSRQNAVTN